MFYMPDHEEHDKVIKDSAEYSEYVKVPLFKHEVLSIKAGKYLSLADEIELDAYIGHIDTFLQYANENKQCELVHIDHEGNDTKH